MRLRRPRKSYNSGYFHHKHAKQQHTTQILKDTFEPERALSIAINIEMGNKNQQRISSNNNGVNAIQDFTRFLCANTFAQQRNRNTFNREQMAFVRTVCKTGHPHTARFLPFWVTNVTTVDF